VCEGDGQITRTRRHGVSVFPSLRGLFRYLEERDAELDDKVVLELEGSLTNDLDLDADAGAVLIQPRTVVRAMTVGEARAEAGGGGRRTAGFG
jgi:hypothetical protein